MDIAIQIATSVAAAALVAISVFVWRKSSEVRKLTRAYRLSVERMKLSGVTEIFFQRSQYAGAASPDRANILRYLGTAKLRMRYVGLWMAQASEQYRLDEVLYSLVERGCEVEFVIIDPRMSNSRLKAVADTLGAPEKEVRERARIALDKLVHLRSSLPPSLAGRLRVAVHDVPLIMSIIEFDWDSEHHRCWLDIKLRQRGRSESISLEVENTTDGLLKRITASFDDVLSRAQDV